MKKTIFTQKSPAAIGPYSQAIVANDFIFVSGQIPVNPSTGEVVNANILSQAEQVMKNISAILEEAGVTMSHVVKTTCFLKTMDDFSQFNSVYEKYFVSKPARSCIAVKSLPKDVLCEVEVIAAFD